MEFFMCLSTLLYVWINTLNHAVCYDQLVIAGKTVAESSSTYYETNYEGSAYKTIDKNFNQKTYKDCMHTYPGKSEAWLKLDLGDIYNLESVKIWYRDDRLRSIIRLEGFSLFASKNPNMNKNDTCYQDQGKTTLKSVLQVPCSRTARYVKIFTDKTKDDGPILEICEVEIFGCQRKKYGERCIPCDACKVDCDRTGRCDTSGCLHDRYIPPLCQACNKGLYGKNCTLPCGHCQNNATCDHVTGSCPSGLCEPGWRHTLDKRCNQDCDDGTFGYYCSNNCSGHCAGGFPCSSSDGICTGGCEAGWTNHYCNETCKQGLYGKNCARFCGHCLNKATCDHVTGSCPSGLCEPGWKHTFERRCNQECDDGTFGYYCSNNCSGHCAGGFPCRKSDGICIGGCNDGWTNHYCNETCNDGWYGRECKEPCGYCRGNKPCNHVTGSCSRLCAPGYSGDKCEAGIFTQHLGNQREMIKLMRELLAVKRRKANLIYNGTSPTDF